MSTKSSRKNFVQHAGIASLAVLGSRMMGLVREQFFAYFFGASREYDAFLTAFRIPNLLRDLVAEGALSSAFVPVFISYKEKSQQEANQLANSLMIGFSLFLFALIGLATWQADHLVYLFAVGFDPGKIAFTARLLRPMLWFIWFMTMASIAMGILNSEGKFALPQSASTFFNIGSVLMGMTIIAILYPDYYSQRNSLDISSSVSFSEQAMFAMTLGVLFGGWLQWFVQVPSLYRLGYVWRWEPNWLSHPGLWKILRLMLPAVLGAAAVQLNVFVNSNYASTLGDKAISWLSYSFRLMQFPIGVFGVAITSATLPALSRALAKQDFPAFCTTLQVGLLLVLALCLPASCGLAFYATPIVQIIFEHGRFGMADTQATAAAIQMYTVGLSAYAAVKLLAPACISLGYAKIPMWLGLFTVALNVMTNYVMIEYLKFDHRGLAMSTSFMVLVQAFGLAIWLYRYGIHWFTWDFSRHLVGIFFATGGMMLTAVLMDRLWGGFPHAFHLTAFYLISSIAACSMIYGSLLYWTGVIQSILNHQKG